MGRFVKGDIVRILFRFSDLKNAKPRPALVLADLAGQDSILCQITKKRPTFDQGIELTQDSFTGSPLPVIPSYVRPAKLFTADNSLIDKKVATVSEDILKQVYEVLNSLFSI